MSYFRLGLALCGSLETKSLSLPLLAPPQRATPIGACLCQMSMLAAGQMDTQNCDFLQEVVTIRLCGKFALTTLIQG